MGAEGIYFIVALPLFAPIDFTVSWLIIICSCLPCGIFCFHFNYTWVKLLLLIGDVNYQFSMINSILLSETKVFQI